MTTISPTERTIKTLIGTQRELEAVNGATMNNNIRTTLNTKYGVQASTLPTRYPTVKYAGIGINGRHAVDSGFLTAPNEVKATNMDLYLPLPWRLVPLAQDLSAATRANYRMRRLMMINDTAYVGYYLKALSFTTSSVLFTQTDPNTQIETEYQLDDANLYPVPPQSSTNGVVTNTADEINVSLAASLFITGAEVTEAVNVLYDGNMQYATISELGLYTGEDQVVQARDASNVLFNYTEAVFAQLSQHYTWNGSDFSNPTKSEEILFRFIKQDVVLSS